MGRLWLQLTPKPADKTCAELADMMGQREDIKAMMRAENNRQKQARLACVARDIRAVLAHVQAHRPLRTAAVRLQTTPGIGPILSAALIAGLPELGRMDRRQIAALSGLAPHASDSGYFKGKRRKVRDVTRADISKLHGSLRSTPYQANRALALLSKAFSLAEVWGLRPDSSNPCMRVQRFEEKSRERFLSEKEFAELGAWHTICYV